MRITVEFRVGVSKKVGSKTVEVTKPVHDMDELVEYCRGRFFSGQHDNENYIKLVDCSDPWFPFEKILVPVKSSQDVKFDRSLRGMDHEV